MTSYVSSGVCTGYYTPVPTILVNYNYLNLIASVPGDCTIVLTITDSIIGTILFTGPLADGTTRLNLGGRLMESVYIDITLTGSGSATPSLNIEIDYDLPKGDIVAQPNTVNVENKIKTVNHKEKPYYCNGAMVYFPAGCKNLVSIYLVKGGTSIKHPGNELTISNALIGDDEVKYFEINKEEFNLGESLIAVVSNEDNYPHKLLVYPSMKVI